MATLRLLFKRPAYVLACIAILALGIGANTAIFTVVYSVILKPLPYPHSGRLVFIFERYPFFGDLFGDRMPVRRTNYSEWRQRADLFEGTAAFLQRDLRDSRPEQPPVASVFVSSDLFALLGARPELGRLFAGDEDQLSAEPVAVLSYDFFETRFQHNPAAVGQRLRLADVDYTIIGVLPPRFHLPTYANPRPKIWLPLARAWTRPEQDVAGLLTVAAKLRADITRERARREMNALMARLFAADPGRHFAREVSVLSFAEENSSPDLSRTLYLLLGAVGFLLLIGCANLANLTLARASLRAREIAVRRALGASRAAIVAQLLKESLVVSTLGAAAGVLVSYWSVAGIVALEPPGLERPDEIYVDFAVLAFTAAVSVLTALLFGLAPAIAASRTSVNAALKTGGSGGASARRGFSRRWLIAAEVAMALVLVTGAGLTLRSFANVIRAGIGMDMAGLVAADATLPEDRYANAPARARFFEQWMERAGAIPGVEAVTVADALPMHRINASTFEIAGRPRPDAATAQAITSDHANVGAEYFRVLRLPLLDGRDFVPTDVERDPQARNGVVIVNQAFADQFLPGGTAVGQRLTANGGDRMWEIVGVVANYRAAGAENPVRPQRFYPSHDIPQGMLIARTAVDPVSTAGPLRAAMAAIDPGLTPGPVETLRHYFNTFPDLVARRFTALLLTMFAGLALVLAMTGVYSVMANLVASQTREIGIRVALGATPAGVGGMVLRDCLRPVFIGLAVGLGGSLALTRVLESQMRLFQVGTYDPLTLALSVAAILMVVPLAVYVPLRRATRVNCTVALRDE